MTNTRRCSRLCGFRRERGEPFSERICFRLMFRFGLPGEICAPGFFYNTLAQMHFLWYT